MFNIFTNILAATENLDQSLKQSQDIFHRLTATVFNLRSLAALLLALALSIALGRVIAMLLHRITIWLSREADKTENLKRVNSLRRLETLIVLSVAVIKALLLAIGIYFWWNFAYPKHNPTAVIGASAIFIIIVGGALGPALRDIAAGSLMMAEQWFGVGDHIRVEPFVDLQGVVERVTLRSTRIRGLNGEVIWVNNQTIQAVRVTPKGSRTMALELFVSNIERGLSLIEQTNLRLPSSPLMVVSPLTAMTSTEIGKGTWQITAIGETAPGREWLIETYAINLMNDIDNDENTKPVLLNTPIARYADDEAELKFARTIKNARKLPVKRLRRRSTKK